jgi:peptide chain release factor 2
VLALAVAVQQERSQHQNRAKAIQMLKARLYELELQKCEAERLEAEASKTDIGWGHQIQSCVLQPYQMVKDLRTYVERADSQKVLDGNLDEFMAASLAVRSWSIFTSRKIRTAVSSSLTIARYPCPTMMTPRRQKPRR